MVVFEQGAHAPRAPPDPIHIGREARLGKGFVIGFAIEPSGHGAQADAWAHMSLHSGKATALYMCARRPPRTWPNWPTLRTLACKRRYALVMEAIFSGLQVLIAIGLIFLVLMHSGKDSGLSGAFGVGSGQGPLGGGSMVERNLNRWTIAFAIVFALNTILLLKKPW